MTQPYKKTGSIGETIKTVVIALVFAGLIRTLFFQPFWIPSSSMKSTLLVGDFMFVNKMAYGYSKYSCPFSMCLFSGRIFGRDPKVGDIIVFKHPVSYVDYIKRLIGKPGDTVQMVNGVLMINDKPVKMERIGTFTETFDEQGSMSSMPRCISRNVPIGGVCEKEEYRETLPNGVQHLVLNIGNSQLDNTPRFTVPEGKYFFMGDNRDNSSDSRLPSVVGGVGFVPFENFVGRADRVLFSSAGKRILYFWTWRKDRFFKALD